VHFKQVWEVTAHFANECNLPVDQITYNMWNRRLSRTRMKVGCTGLSLTWAQFYMQMVGSCILSQAAEHNNHEEEEAEEAYSRMEYSLSIVK